MNRSSQDIQAHMPLKQNKEKQMQTKQMQLASAICTCTIYHKVANSEKSTMSSKRLNKAEEYDSTILLTGQRIRCVTNTVTKDKLVGVNTSTLLIQFIHYMCPRVCIQSDHTNERHCDKISPLIVLKHITTQLNEL